VGFRLFLRPKAQQKRVTVFDQTFVKSLRVRNASGWDPLLRKDKIEGFGVRALDDLQITDYCLKGVDGAIVAVAHDEFQGMGLSGVSVFLGAGAVMA
jgi:hypothetical protein